MTHSSIKLILNDWEAGHTLFNISEKYDIEPEHLMQLLMNWGVYE